ncbi:MAG: relaxase/mobilization nuclease domain-containing protein [Sphingomonadaceae bacterium]|nr:relaxase/mobilization nuclease domain-containing protein [Sphingomonadaceae bacterium]
MILKGAQRGGAKQLGLHLLKTTENEHVEVHEVRGFMASDLLGALREAEAISKGTRCTQPLFSVSLNPPQTESVRTEVFETALAAIEERNGLTGQPRVVVFHEKEGRRHCHAVWSRIDAETMTAKPLPWFKLRLREVSKQLYLENGWKMPRGMIDYEDRDPRNFTLAQWQKSKRYGYDAGEFKGAVEECWAVSDDRKSFESALEQRGIYLAKGDRRAYVAVSYDGVVHSLARIFRQKDIDVAARLGPASELRSVADTRTRIAKDIAPRMNSYLQEARADTRDKLAPLEAQRQAMAAKHQLERAKLDAGLKAREEQEMRERNERLRKGLAGLWDRLRGEHAKRQKQNELEALFALQRDREQRHALVQDQLRERAELAHQMREVRNHHLERLRALHRDAANYRLMERGEAPKLQQEFEQVQPKAEQRERPMAAQAPPKLETPTQSFGQSAQPEKPAAKSPQRPSQQDRLRNLREGRKRDPKSRDRGHEPDFEF